MCVRRRYPRFSYLHSRCWLSNTSRVERKANLSLDLAECFGIHKLFIIMKKEEIAKILFNQTNSAESPDTSRYLFEQYKLYIESVERVSDRRLKTNEFFLGLNTAIIAVVGVALGKSGTHIPAIFYIFISIAGTAICYLWYRILLSYKGLNRGKLEVAHTIETKLPLSLYDTEWEVLGRGEDKQKYWPFTHIELNVPWIFIIIYSFILLKYLIPIVILLYPVLFKGRG